ncbi:hypothetical protein PR048_009333, partial [Dryococelus australis]
MMLLSRATYGRKNTYNNCSLTVTLDGWSSVKNDLIQVITSYTGKEKAAMKECQENLHSSILAVVTDNKNKIGKIWEILKEKHPDLITYGCSTHLLNLVEKYVSPKTVTCHIVEVQMYFRKVHKAHGWLLEEYCVMPQLPNETLAEHHPKFLPGITAFKISDPDYYPASMRHTNVVEDFSLQKWWQIMANKNKRNSNFPFRFCHFSFCFNSAPASSASIVRYFFTFGLVWNKLCNHLRVNKATKL